MASARNRTAAQVTRKGFEILEERNRRAKTDLERLLALKKPPAYAFQLALRRALTVGTSLENKEKFVKRSMELYPNYFDVHTSLMISLLPRWGGDPGECNAYLNAIAELYPADIRDEVYSLIAVQFLRIYDLGVIQPTEGNLRPRRILKAGKELCQNPCLHSGIVEFMIEVASMTNEPKYLAELVDLHLARYPQPSYLGNFREVRDILDRRKTVLLQQKSK